MKQILKTFAMLFSVALLVCACDSPTILFIADQSDGDSKDGDTAEADDESSEFLPDGDIPYPDGDKLIPDGDPDFDPFIDGDSDSPELPVDGDEEIPHVAECLRRGGYCEPPIASACYRSGFQPAGDLLGCDEDGSFCCLPLSDCPTYIAARADCPYQFVSEGVAASCPEALCMDTPCETDDDCPLSAAMEAGGYCVTGNCVYCWNDEQCLDDLLCRSGRCAPPAIDCPDAPPCSNERCRLVDLSEHSCPVCVCDSIHALSCEDDFDCLVISSHPYSRCVYGRCADCRSDEDCSYGECLPPGLCFPMRPLPHVLYGTWLIGVGAGMDHFSYFRIEPDGTLRRGAYVAEGAWSDDIPFMPCYPDIDPPVMPLLGSWEPLVTQSDQLILIMTLNISCDMGDGWRMRLRFELDEDGERAVLWDIDQPENQVFDAFKMETDACQADFSSCELPSNIDY